VRDKKQFVSEKYNQAEKTTHAVHGNTIIHSVKLTSGDVIVEHCICMDPNNFDIEKGLSLCKEKVIKRLMKMYEPVSGKAVGGLVTQPITKNMAREMATTVNIIHECSAPSMKTIMKNINDEVVKSLNNCNRMMR